MIGVYSDDAGKTRGFLRDGALFTTFDAPGAAVATLPLGINNQGQIVGGAFDDVRRFGFMLKSGTFTALAAPGAFLEAFPFDIDERGRIVGFSF
jgi:hypothetical protein